MCGWKEGCVCVQQGVGHMTKLTWDTVAEYVPSCCLVWSLSYHRCGL